MAMNYNKLWKLLIDRNMMKKDLIQLAGISTNAMAKMGKGGDVSTQVLRKICIALDCKIEDIVEIIPDESVFLDISHGMFRKEGVEVCGAKIVTWKQTKKPATFAVKIQSKTFLLRFIGAAIVELRLSKLLNKQTKGFVRCANPKQNI